MGLKDKTKERPWYMLEQKGKENTRKNNSTTCGNEPESTGERRKIKEISTKFYQHLGGKDTKIYQQLDAKETERFWTKTWQTKNITKRLHG